MKKLIIGKTISVVREFFPEYDEDKVCEIRYGLESIYLSLTKLVVILLLSIIFQIFKETLILIVLFNGLRITGFGLHASKSWMCWVSSIFSFLIVPLLCKYIEVPTTVLTIVSSVCLLCFLLFAPADTVKRPLIKKKKRIIYKVLTVLIASIYFIAILFIDNSFLKNAFTVAMVVECILILPLTYKIFKLPYNNYKTYLANMNHGLNS